MKNSWRKCRLLYKEKSAKELWGATFMRLLHSLQPRRFSRAHGRIAMNKLLWFGLLILILTPSRAKAQSPFDGFWVRDLTTAQLPTKPTKYLLQNGVLRCDICHPPLDVKVDGQDHLIPSDDGCRNIAFHAMSSRQNCTVRIRASQVTRTILWSP